MDIMVRALPNSCRFYGEFDAMRLVKGRSGRSAADLSNEAATFDYTRQASAPHAQRGPGPVKVDAPGGRRSVWRPAVAHFHHRRGGAYGSPGGSWAIGGLGTAKIYRLTVSPKHLCIITVLNTCIVLYTPCTPSLSRFGPCGRDPQRR